MKSSQHRSSSVSRRGRSTAHLHTAAPSRRLRIETLEDRRMLTGDVSNLLVPAPTNVIELGPGDDRVLVSRAGTNSLSR